MLPCPWDFPGKNTGVGCHGLLQGNLPNPGIKPRSPALQADSLGNLPGIGKPMNIAVVEYPFSRGIFLIQDLNWGLLQYRWILYQLS